MSAGRTGWWAKDNGWHRRDRVVELGLKFGPAGPLLLDWLSCEADAQRENGTVKSGFVAAAHGCHTDPDRIREVSDYAAVIGALDDYEVSACGRLYVARVSGWRSDQERAREAAKKAAWRARKAAAANGVTP